MKRLRRAWNILNTNVFNSMWCFIKNHSTAASGLMQRKIFVKSIKCAEQINQFDGISMRFEIFLEKTPEHKSNHTIGYASDMFALHINAGQILNGA